MSAKGNLRQAATSLSANECDDYITIYSKGKRFISIAEKARQVDCNDEMNGDGDDDALRFGFVSVWVRGRCVGCILAGRRRTKIMAGNDSTCQSSDHQPQHHSSRKKQHK
jgi:hypothetical protein